MSSHTEYKPTTSLEKRDYEWAETVLQNIKNVLDTVTRHGFKDKSWVKEFRKELLNLGYD